MMDTRRVVDSQWHWYPRAFFEDVAGRQTLPRCEIADGDYRLEITPGEELVFPIAETEIEAQIAAMDAGGVSAAIVSPGTLTVESFGPFEATRLANVLNEEMGRAQARYPDRVVGAATIPFTSPGAAIEVLDHAVGALGLRVVWLPSNASGGLIDLPAFMPLFERIQALGVVAVLHPVRTMMAEKLDRYGLEYIAGFPVDTSFAALTLILGGVTESLPDLKVLHPHLGGVLPYLAARIDREYLNPWAGNSALPHPPSAYIKRFYTDTVSESPQALELAVGFYGTDHVLFGSDHPWWPVKAGIDFVVQNTRDQVTSAVLAGNADALFGLEPSGAARR
jgi:aminocarboxymuconate-semialdehyde decarboxylase